MDIEINTKTNLSVAEDAVTKLARKLRDAKQELKELDKASEEYAKKKAEIDALTKSYNSQKDALADLKKETKETEKALKEQEKAAKKTAEAFAENKDRMGDLKDEAILLQGSGIERLNNSFGLLREGFENVDVDKLKTAFKGLGAAMSAIPILLLVEGVKLIIENFDKAKEVFKTVFNIFSEGEVRTRNLTRALEAQKKINETVVSALENEIKVLEAQGVSSAKILAKKKELNALKIKELEIDAQLQKARIQEIIDNDTLYESYLRKSAAVLDSLGQEEKAAQILKQIDINKKERAEESLKKFKEDTIAINNLKTEDRVNEINYEKDQKQKAKDVRIARREDAEDAINVERETREKRRKLEAEDNLLKAEIEKEKKQRDEDEANALFEKLVEQQTTEAEIKRQFREKDKQEERDAIAAGFEFSKQGITSLQSLSDTYFAVKQANLKAGSAAEEAAARKQFQINKGLQIASATISGIQGVINALTAQSVIPEPYGTALRIATAVAVAASTAANIAKISSTQFNAGGSGGSISVPRTGLSSNTSTPSTPTPQLNISNQSTQFDKDGNKIVPQAKVTILQSEIKDANRTSTRIEQQAKF